MTREEREDAINFFKEVAKREAGTYCKLAIEALEQEPCEDYVSRQAVIDIMKNHWLSGTVAHRVIDEIELSINALPPVSPKEKTGKWIKYSTPICGDQHYQCTSCGYYINFGQWGEVYTKEFKYCPNCGIKMVELQESEE